jgi:hypothetical protein
MSRPTPPTYKTSNWPVTLPEPSLPNSITARGVIEGHAQRPDTRPIDDISKRSKIILAKQGASIHDGVFDGVFDGSLTSCRKSRSGRCDGFHASRSTYLNSGPPVSSDPCITAPAKAYQR